MSSYTVLGIMPDATDDEVRLAYKHKALECHPDRHANDKDLATRNFIELNTAYRAVLRERARKTAASQKSASNRPPEKPAEQQDDAKEPTPSKASPSTSDSSTRSFKSTCSSSSSTPSSTPLSSPFTTPSSSPYSSPASSPASSSTSLPDEKDSDSLSTKSSATCDDVDDHSSTACGSTTNHTAKPSSGASPKPPRAKLRKQHPKKSPKSNSSSSSTTSSHDYECRDSRYEPTYTASPTKSSSNHGHSNDHAKPHPKHGRTKYKATELKEYYNSFPSLKDYPKVDLAPEWTYPLPLTLEDIFHGKRLCYRIKRRYLTGNTKAVVLDVDVPPGCRSGTKIVFRDAGHERRDGTKQDLVFVVTEAKHERFVRGHEWDGSGGESRDEGKDEKKDKDRRNHRDQDGDKQEKTSDKKPRKHRRYKEDDLVLEVRLPWVDRLKDEKAKVVVSGVDGKELVFEVDCRSGKGRDGKMTGIYIVEDAGMPVRSNTRSPGDDDGGKGIDASAGVNWTGQRGRLIIRWEIFVPTSASSSKWESFKQILKFGK